MQPYLVPVAQNGQPVQASTLPVAPVWLSFLNAATNAAIAGPPAIGALATTDALSISYDPTAAEAYGIIDLGAGFTDPDERYLDLYLCQSPPLLTVVTARQGGVPTSGLVPTWVAGSPVSATGAALGALAIAEIGAGGYRIAGQTALSYGTLDFGAAQAAGERYADVVMGSVPNGSVLAAVTAALGAVGLTPASPAATGDGQGRATLAPHSLDAVLAPADVTTDASARATFGGMVRALFNRFYGEVNQTAAQQTVKNDAGAVVSTMAVSDDGTTAIKTKSA